MRADGVARVRRSRDARDHMEMQRP